MRFEDRPVHARRAAALSVHLFTALGTPVAMLALDAAFERRFPACFAWLGLALFIDGIDGTLARLARVSESAVVIDGVVLDLVVDFLTYVVVPVVALWRSDLMPETLSFWIGLVVTFASALYFADTRMKTGDYWFRGFPALWNVLALYLFVLRPPGIVCAFLLLLGCGLMFAPIVFVHPLRVEKLRTVTIAVCILFLALSAVAVRQNLQVEAWVKLGFAAIAVYFLGLPFLRHSPWAET
jgi:phosphatidylcholine synthase